MFCKAKNTNVFLNFSCYFFYLSRFHGEKGWLERTVLRYSWNATIFKGIISSLNLIGILLPVLFYYFQKKKTTRSQVDSSYLNSWKYLEVSGNQIPSNRLEKCILKPHNFVMMISFELIAKVLIYCSSASLLIIQTWLISASVRN